MFYFQSMFQQVYKGITGSAVLPAVQRLPGEFEVVEFHDRFHVRFQLG